ncbi:MAG: hypothetical protein NC408_09795 [Candidatus Gastranaerophilales bacterium]|nr:hypothetical protein [Candidatus Gastranaerophilales bacterium]MCM1072870.1 hypothetical protein [Bacteroides sp.]
MVNSLDLSLIQSLSNLTSTSVGKNDSVVYARKGEPMYQKEMDADEDGVITFQEFNDYCDENDISYSQRSEILQNRLQFQLHSDRAKSSEQIRQIESKGEAVYAEEGDDKYSEEIDANSDGKITYDEYMKYCEEQEKAQTNQQPQKAELSKDDEKIVVKNEGKAINQYAQAESETPESKIEDEA